MHVGVIRGQATRPAERKLVALFIEHLPADGGPLTLISMGVNFLAEVFSSVRQLASLPIPMMVLESANQYGRSLNQRINTRTGENLLHNCERSLKVVLFFLPFLCQPFSKSRQMMRLQS